MATFEITPDDEATIMALRRLRRRLGDLTPPSAPKPVADEREAEDD